VVWCGGIPGSGSGLAKGERDQEKSVWQKHRSEEDGEKTKRQTGTGSLGKEHRCSLEG
jgi:hypothetical protein